MTNIDNPGRMSDEETAVLPDASNEPEESGKLYSEPSDITDSMPRENLAEEEEMVPRRKYEADLSAAGERVALLQRQIDDLRNRCKEDLLLRLVSDWAIDPEGVLAMVRDRFILNAQGELRLASSEELPEQMQTGDNANDINAFFKNFQQNKPYMVKAADSTGAGSLTRQSDNYLSGSIDHLADLSMAQFIQAGGLFGRFR